MPEIDQKRLEVLATTVGFGGYVGAPATRDEERVMAKELVRARKIIAKVRTIVDDEQHGGMLGEAMLADIELRELLAGRDLS